MQCPLALFDSLVKPIDARLYSVNRISRTLAAIRDAHLPKLISGEPRVYDAEGFIGRVLQWQEMDRMDVIERGSR